MFGSRKQNDEPKKPGLYEQYLQGRLKGQFKPGSVAPSGEKKDEQEQATRESKTEPPKRSFSLNVALFLLLVVVVLLFATSSAVAPAFVLFSLAKSVLGGFIGSILSHTLAWIAGPMILLLLIIAGNQELRGFGWRGALTAFLVPFVALGAMVPLQHYVIEPALKEAEPNIFYEELFGGLFLPQLSFLDAQLDALRYAYRVRQLRDGPAEPDVLCYGTPTSTDPILGAYEEPVLWWRGQVALPPGEFALRHEVAVYNTDFTIAAQGTSSAITTFIGTSTATSTVSSTGAGHTWTVVFADTAFSEQKLWGVSEQNEQAVLGMTLGLDDETLAPLERIFYFTPIPLDLAGWVLAVEPAEEFGGYRCHDFAADGPIETPEYQKVLMQMQIVEQGLAQDMNEPKPEPEPAPAPSPAPSPAPQPTPQPQPEPAPQPAPAPVPAPTPAPEPEPDYDDDTTGDTTGGAAPPPPPPPPPPSF